MHPSVSHELSNIVKTGITSLSSRHGKIPEIAVKAPPRIHLSGQSAILNHSFAAQIVCTKWNPISQNKRFASIVRKADPEKGVYTVPLDQNEYKTGANRAEYEKGKTYSYMMIGATGVLGAITARNLVNGYIDHFTASADVLAVAKVEIGLSSIPEGKNAVIKWRGKPIFVRHRTDEEIAEANSVDLSSLRHPESDSDRTKDPKWLIMIGVCTHLGCIPVGEAGDFGGWFCPCHGSHYDISGRIRKGPAPLNLEIPQYTLDEDNDKLVIG